LHPIGIKVKDRSLTTAGRSWERRRLVCSYLEKPAGGTPALVCLKVYLV